MLIDLDKNGSTVVLQEKPLQTPSFGNPSPIICDPEYFLKSNLAHTMRPIVFCIYAKKWEDP